jgi:hydrogenase expression/formation protein HypD
MKYIDEYRDADKVKIISNAIHKITTQSWTLMEVCGGQTHTIVKYRLDELLPSSINLLHGPGCPVCVTPLEKIDLALELAARNDVIFCSFGDMLRVPGSQFELMSIKARGGDVRVLYSPIDALEIAKQEPSKQVVFFGIGFETTAPINAMVIYQAHLQKIDNFSMLVSQSLVPPAINTLLSSELSTINGFLAAGHVCSVMGYEEYIPIADKFRIPIVVTGFEPLDLLNGIYMCVKQLEEGHSSVLNQYSRSVEKSGNLEAQSIMKKIFKVVDQNWRGIGVIPNSGLAINDEFVYYDAERRFNLQIQKVEYSSECISGLVLQGVKKPYDCSCFGTTCTPTHPLGATMVSSEGACAAYYKYRSKSVY